MPTAYVSRSCELPPRSPWDGEVCGQSTTSVVTGVPLSVSISVIRSGTVSTTRPVAEDQVFDLERDRCALRALRLESLEAMVRSYLLWMRRVRAYEHPERTPTTSAAGHGRWDPTCRRAWHLGPEPVAVHSGARAARPDRPSARPSGARRRANAAAARPLMRWPFSSPRLNLIHDLVRAGRTHYVLDDFLTSC
jgi:hypothetical protein